MNHRARRIVETLACERRYGIADEKGAEYSGQGSTYKETGADTLANFKRVGERRGISAESALMVYLDKHMDSISTAVREQNYKSGEGIVSRLDDARNYLDLLECLLIDNGHIAQPDPDSYESTTKHDVSAAEQYIRDYSPVIGVKAPDNLLNEKDLKEAGLVEGLDGVWRGATKIDESVAPDALRETPICQTATAAEADRYYGETGEL